METLDAPLLFSMFGFVVAFLLGKHLQAGYDRLSTRLRPAEQPIRRDH